MLVRRLNIYANQLMKLKHELLKYNWDWNSMIRVLKKLTPELETLLNNSLPKNSDKYLEIGSLLSSIETHLTLYDIETLWERVVEAIDFLNVNNYTKITG